MVLPCSLSMCFFCPFSILITLLGEEGAGLVLIVLLFVSYLHVNLCHFFSSSWCRDLTAAYACGSSWTFLFTFLEITLGGHQMLMKNITAHNVQWSMPINFQGGDNWFDLLFPLYKVKGQLLHIHV